jgi:serine/threonine protein kinase
MIHGQRCDPQFRDRLWQEARAAAAVNHPNICQIYEVGEETEALFIVMELLEGESLARRLRCGPLTVEEAVSVGLGILSGLEALQRQRIVHRDLKPSNVFLTTHGVKLVDVGLAKPLTGMDAALEAPTGDTLTQSGVVVGTPQYMSPETFRVSLPIHDQIYSPPELFCLKWSRASLPSPEKPSRNSSTPLFTSPRNL